MSVIHHIVVQNKKWTTEYKVIIINHRSCDPPDHQLEKHYELPNSVRIGGGWTLWKGGYYPPRGPWGQGDHDEHYPGGPLSSVTLLSLWHW